MRKSSLIISAIVIAVLAIGIVFRPTVASIFSSEAAQQVKDLEKTIETDSERLAELEQEGDNKAAEIDVLTAEIETAQQQIAKIKQTMPENKKAHDEAQAKIGEAVRLRESAEAQIKASEDAIAAARDEQKAAGFEVDEEDIDANPAVSVAIKRSTEAPVTSGILLRGQTAAFKSIAVKAETQGAVISQPLRKGTVVKEGQLLCELEIGTKAAAVAEAKARLIEAEANNNASSELVKKGFASETQVKSREAALEAAIAGLERAETDLENTKIIAPFDGILESDTAEFGDFIQPGVPCATVLALDPIKLVGYATELQVSQIVAGALAGARLIDGKEVVGKVTFVSRSADPTTRTYLVEVTVPNSDQQIRDGATADIFIALEGVKGHLVPPSSLTLNGEGVLGLRVAQDGVARFVPVTIIRDTPDGIWLSGLPESTDVIVLGQEYVTDGTPIKTTIKE